MKILLIHNFYQQPGGEDAVFRAESDMLRRIGHEVETYTDHNDRLTRMNPLRAAGSTIWSPESYREILAVARAFRPDVAHFYNTFLLVSPSGYAACRAAGVPVVQTIQNYRMLCPAGILYRDGHICTECIGRTPWPAIRHGCYRGSRMQSAVVAAMLVHGRLRGAFRQLVDLYLPLTPFMKDLLSRSGLPAEKMIVKPNGLPSDPGARSGSGSYGLYLGRLTEEKGILDLLRAWPDGAFPLRIVGQGPAEAAVQKWIENHPRQTIHLTGWQPQEEVIAQLKSASFLAVPSRWFEGCPMVVLEAFACGVPVLAPRLGGLPAIVRDGESGCVFEPNDPFGLGKTVRWAIGNLAALSEMGHVARCDFEEKFSPDRTVENLLRAYRSVGRA